MSALIKSQLVKFLIGKPIHNAAFHKSQKMEFASDNYPSSIIFIVSSTVLLLDYPQHT